MTTAFLYTDHRWLVSTLEVPRESQFTDKLVNCNSVPEVCKYFPKIKSSADYNELIDKLRDPSLRGRNIMKSIVSARAYYGAEKLSPDNYPINYGSNQSQLYCNNNGKSSILLFFSGNGYPELPIDTRFGIPLLAFHAKYSHLFGSIAYFYESELFDYNCLLKKINAVFSAVPNHGKIILMGVSAGGYLPIILKNELGAFASFSFSPIYTKVCTKGQFKKKYYLNSSFSELLWSNRMKVFYSKMDPRDVEFVESCKLNLRKFTADKVFEDISDIDPDHNSLMTLHESGILHKRLEALGID